MTVVGVGSGSDRPADVSRLVGRPGDRPQLCDGSGPVGRGYALPRLSSRRIWTGPLADMSTGQAMRPTGPR